MVFTKQLHEKDVRPLYNSTNLSKGTVLQFLHCYLEGRVGGNLDDDLPLVETGRAPRANDRVLPFIHSFIPLTIDESSWIYLFFSSLPWEVGCCQFVSTLKVETEFPILQRLSPSNIWLTVSEFSMWARLHVQKWDSFFNVPQASSSSLYSRYRCRVHWRGRGASSRVSQCLWMLIWLS